MSKNKRHVVSMCRLIKPTGPTSHLVDVAYLPAEFAMPGRCVKIKRKDGSWDDGWTVESCGEPVERTPTQLSVAHDPMSILPSIQEH